MPRLPRLQRLLVVTLTIVAGTLLIAYWATRQAEWRVLLEAGTAGASQAQLYANSLQTLIDRYRTLPAVLALDSEMRTALAGPMDAETSQRLNRRLERINLATGSSTLELMDKTGLAVAASNWRQPTSYAGHNYGFRPYFQQTRVQGTGRFYGVGVISGIPGYFLSQAVLGEDGEFLGAVVVKLEFPELEQSWSQRAEVILVSDARGIVFIANQPGWRYRMLGQLTANDLAELEANRQYDRQPLTPLTYRNLRELAPGQRLTRIEGPADRKDFLWNSLPLAETGWTLHLLRDTHEFAADARTAGFAVAGAWLALVFAGLLLHQRWRLARERQRSRGELERLVEARTTALRTAQDGLVQAAKLAALGQMSAALAHELNQPLTAQRMHLASLHMLLDRQRIDEAREAVGRLDALLTRMAALTGHLKTYARKTPGGLREAVDLARVVDHALELLVARVRTEEVHVELHLARPARVLGDGIRLEQVLVNLLRNALDAMTGKNERRLTIDLELHGNKWRLAVTDTGGGIAAEDLPQIFDPFFTTKPVGEGLGLGLAVSYAIVHELGGNLSADNTGSGARFSMILPAALETEE
ncbi:sensor histidine kinase [Azomonas macrocytogenes]|uniref:C4-dicarboxylate transport sensor protein DctB n=1 Tax=Azomonas macrocytogenes TaxID=69962 RepID=A0A839T8U3_AZOMA|nr:ATP-binding protein [Azomonas macrocytogenes]MBB3104886.1 two-component system C4-dicarboxylate transport sensor histidine kinase DctB [Azomonas macrocytogenes]